MNLRKFLKTLVIGGVSAPVIGVAIPKKDDIVIEKIPCPPKNKHVKFEKNGVHFTLWSTTNVIIHSPESDNWYMNVYCEYCKVIGLARDHEDSQYAGKVVRLEGDLIEVKELESKWQSQVKKLVRIGLKAHS